MKKITIFILILFFILPTLYSMEEENLKAFQLFKELPVELKEHIIKIYLSEELDKERDIKKLIKKILNLRTTSKEINNVVVRQVFWDNIFEKFFYNLLHKETKKDEVDAQLSKIIILIEKGCQKKARYIAKEIPIESEIFFNFIIPNLVLKVDRIEQSKNYVYNKHIPSFLVCMQLLIYIKESSSEEIAKFIDDIKSKVSNLWHPLLIHLLSGEDTKSDALKVLIKAGANINSQYVHGRTPLMEAVNNCAKSNVKILIDAGANLEIKDDEDQTALDMVLINVQTAETEELRQQYEELFKCLLK